MDGDWVFASPPMEGETTLLTGHSYEAVYQAGGTSVRQHQENRLAHLPSLFRHSAEGKRGRCEDGTGAPKAREQQDHARLYTQAVNSHKRAAQRKVIRMMMPDVGHREAETDSLLAPRRA